MIVVIDNIYKDSDQNHFPKSLPNHPFWTLLSNFGY